MGRQEKKGEVFHEFTLLVQLRLISLSAYRRLEGILCI